MKLPEKAALYISSRHGIAGKRNLILVFISVFAFLLGYLKLFPRPNKLKLILAATAFSVLVSFLVSFPSVYGTYVAYGSDVHALALENSVLTRLSLPFYLETYALGRGSLDSLWIRICCAGIRLQVMEFDIKLREGRCYIHPTRQFNVDITAQVLSQLFLTFTALNMIGMPLAAFTYVCTLKIWKFAKKLISRIARFT